MQRSRQGAMEEDGDATPTTSRDTESVAVTAVADVGDNDGHTSREAPLNAVQLRDRTRRRRHTIKKLEKKLEVLHRQIKK